MAETLHKLVVVLNAFLQQFLAQYAHHKKADQEIESAFRLDGTGIENYEKTTAGT